jgi:hypothetical protein
MRESGVRQKNVKDKVAVTLLSFLGRIPSVVGSIDCLSLPKRTVGNCDVGIIEC